MTGATTGATVVASRTELAGALAKLRRDRRSLALVPTMGALHAGHRALVERAARVADAVAVSVFVNPLQFGAGEDLDRYPRSLDDDVRLAASAGAALVFAPATREMYPAGDPAVRVCAGPLGDVLEGEVRPGHFDGVLTVVAKLLALVAPDVVVFGEKDAQQLVLVRRMVGDLDLRVRVEAVPTVRDPDGLAVSSRNRFLEPDDRARAVVLSQALLAGERAAGGGGTPQDVRQAARALLDAEPALSLDYCALVDPTRLVAVGASAAGPALLLVAGRIGGTRLIDNTLVELAGGIA